MTRIGTLATLVLPVAQPHVILLMPPRLTDVDANSSVEISG